MSEEKLIAQIEQLEGEARIRALEKVIRRNEGKDKALPFIEKAIEYYDGDPEAIPFVDKAIERRMEAVKEMVGMGPILMVGGWVWSTYFIPFVVRIFPTTRMNLVAGFWVLNAFGNLVFVIGLLYLTIGFPYYLYKFLGLKRFRHRLAQLAG